MFKKCFKTDFFFVKKVTQKLLFLTLLLTNFIFAQEILLPEKVEIGKKIIAEIDTNDLIFWNTPTNLDIEEQNNKLFIWGKPGKYKIEALLIPIELKVLDGTEYKILNGEPSKLEALLEITGSDPNPEVPFPSDQLTVLILRESQETGQLPVAQRAIFTSPKVLKYLNENTLWRIWDDDFSEIDLDNVPDVFKIAYPLVLNKKLPWIAISNVDKGYSGPLPKDIDSLLVLLEEYK